VHSYAYALFAVYRMQDERRTVQSAARRFDVNNDRSLIRIIICIIAP